MSRRMIEQARSDERQQRSASRSDSAAPSAADGQDEGYWAYMQRQLNERTEKLNLVGDSMEQLQENSAGWANDVNKFVSQQKKKAVMGGAYQSDPELPSRMLTSLQSSGASLDSKQAWNGSIEGEHVILPQMQ